MKRYLVFSGADCRPWGGWGDFHKAFDDRAAAEQLAANEDDLNAGYWAHVVDLETLRIVWADGARKDV
jgi:hypothetical protein